MASCGALPERRHTPADRRSDGLATAQREPWFVSASLSGTVSCDNFLLKTLKSLGKTAEYLTFAKYLVILRRRGINSVIGLVLWMFSFPSLPGSTKGVPVGFGRAGRKPILSYSMFV